MVANNAKRQGYKTYWVRPPATRANGSTDSWQLRWPVNAVQINYADQDVATDHLRQKSMATTTNHQYKLYASADGKKWTVVLDKSANKTDIPHGMLNFQNHPNPLSPAGKHSHATGKFAISRIPGLRQRKRGETRPC